MQTQEPNDGMSAQKYKEYPELLLRDYLRGLRDAGLPKIAGHVETIVALILKKYGILPEVRK